MTILAHLSDIHLNGERGRRRKLERGLEQARAAGCTHLILTGDLTAWGERDGFYELADILSSWPEEQVTIVPGNHDGGPKRWLKALCGPLRRFCATSYPGTILDLGDALLVAVDTSFHRRPPAFWALGHVSTEQLRILDMLTQPGDTIGRAIILAMHHGPQVHPLQLFEGLTNRSQICQLLRRGPHIAVCCGHDHRELNLGQIYTAASVRDHPHPLRLYTVVGTRLVPVRAR